MSVFKELWEKVQVHKEHSHGLPPGSIVTVPGASPTTITVMALEVQDLVETEVDDPERLRDYIGKFPATWVHVTGLGDADKLIKIGQQFNLHPLAIEDVVNRRSRTKVEEYPDHLYMVIRLPVLKDEFTTQQFNIFLGRDYVITMQEYKIGYFDPVRERIRKTVPRTRFTKPDYLAYSIIDASIDTFIPILEHYSDLLDTAEEEITSQPEKDTLNRVYSMKRELQELRRAVWPQREALNILMREQNKLVSDMTRVFLRDCYEHAIQLMDLTETYREFSSDLVNLYMTRISNDMNAVMKVLTIIATIFIPLGFIAGVYGMNFNQDVSPLNMPELGWYYGYPFALGVMATCALGLLIYFWWRRWL